MQNQGGGPPGWGNWPHSYAGEGAVASSGAAEAGQDDSGVQIPSAGFADVVQNNPDEMDTQGANSGGGQQDRNDDDQMDTAGNIDTIDTETKYRNIDPAIAAITDDPYLAEKLQEDEELRRLEIRRQEDMDDVSLALALQLQAEEEERNRKREQARKKMPPLYTGPGSDDIDIYVCVAREVQPDHPQPPVSPVKSVPFGSPAPPPPSSSNSPPIPMGLMPPPMLDQIRSNFNFGDDEAMMDDKEDSEDELPDEDDTRIVTVNRFSTVAQLMQAIVKSDVFPIRKVSHIRQITFRALPETPEMRARSLQQYTAPVFGSFFTESGDTQAQQSDSESITSFVALPTKMKISDLPITEDSVFKIILRKKDKYRKRKRRGASVFDEDSNDPPTNSLQSPGKEHGFDEVDIWKKRYMEMHSKFVQAQQKADNLEQDLVLEKLPRLELPDTKRQKAVEDDVANHSNHVFHAKPSAFGAASPQSSSSAPSAAPNPFQPKALPKAFALPELPPSSSSSSAQTPPK